MTSKGSLMAIAIFFGIVCCSGLHADPLLDDYLVAREWALQQRVGGAIDALIESKVDTNSRRKSHEATESTSEKSSSSCAVTASDGGKVYVTGDLIISCR